MASMYTHDYSNEILINSAIDITDVNDTLANWSSYFKIPIQLNQDIHYAMYVSSASITNTIDQFHSTESVFKLNATKLVVNVDIIHANTTALCAYLTQLCDAADIDLIFTLDPATQRIRIRNMSGSTLIIDLSSKYLPFWKKLGFKYDLVESADSIEMDDQDDILLKYICRLTPTQRVYICCPQVRNNSYYPTASNKPILTSIDITGGYGTYNTYSAPFIYEHDLIYNTTYNYLSFQVLDDQYRPIDLRGGGVNLSLVIKQTNFND